VRGMGVVFDVMKCFAVEPAQPIFGSYPDEAGTVLCDAVDVIENQPFLAGIPVRDERGRLNRFAVGNGQGN